MIKYLYHMKPINLKGDVLYPLNRLKEKHPDVYDTHAKKYSYRKELMQAKLSVPNCLWNDVLHFCPVDIGNILDARLAILGASDWNSTNTKYYKIDIENLKKDKIYIYNTIEASVSVSSTIDEMNKNISTWKEGKHLITDKITDGQLAYFEKCSKDPSLPRYLFTAIPHILYLDNLHLNSVEEIEYSLPLA